MSTRPEAVAAVSDDGDPARREVQFDLGEGPGRDAFRGGRPVISSTSGRVAVARLRARPPRPGAGSAFAFPLQLGASRFGVLTFYVELVRILDQPDPAGLIFAEAATRRSSTAGPGTDDGAARTSRPRSVSAPRSTRPRAW